MAKATPSCLSELICLRLHLLLGASQASADCAVLVWVMGSGWSSEMVPSDVKSICIYWCVGVRPLVKASLMKEISIDMVHRISGA